MALFSRQAQSRLFNRSREYKPFLRSDFERRCAYCERPEEFMGGEESFEVEHFRPKSKFPELDCVYSNLYYACRGCNSHKSETWPSDEQLAEDMRFADPCEEDPYVHHFAERADGAVEGKTPCGRYTNAHIRLHRDSVKEWRRLRAEAIADLPMLTALAAYLEQLRSGIPDTTDFDFVGKIDALRRRIDESKRRFRIS